MSTIDCLQKYLEQLAPNQTARFYLDSRAVTAHERFGSGYWLPMYMESVSRLALVGKTNEVTESAQVTYEEVGKASNSRVYTLHCSFDINISSDMNSLLTRIY